MHSIYRFIFWTIMILFFSPTAVTPGVKLIKGWTEGVLQMREGERAIMHVPGTRSSLRSGKILLNSAGFDSDYSNWQALPDFETAYLGYGAKAQGKKGAAVYIPGEESLLLGMLVIALSVKLP